MLEISTYNESAETKSYKKKYVMAIILGINKKVLFLVVHFYIVTNPQNYLFRLGRGI